MANEFFENLKKTLTVTADRAAKKTDEIISVQKVKNKKYSLEKQVDASYRTIGKMIFDEYAEGNPLSEDLAKVCEKIKKLQKDIEACQDEIADIKGETVCDSRGPIQEADIEDADFEEAVEDVAEEVEEEAEKIAESVTEDAAAEETEESVTEE